MTGWGVEREGQQDCVIGPLGRLMQQERRLVPHLLRGCVTCQREIVVRARVPVIEILLGGLIDLVGRQVPGFDQGVVAVAGGLGALELIQRDAVGADFLE